MPPSNLGDMAAGSSAGKTFITTQPGLVALCYEWVPDAAASNLSVGVDGAEIQHHFASAEGVTSHVYTRYVFLAAGTHTFSLGETGATGWVEGVSAGLVSPPADTLSATIDSASPASSLASQSVSFAGHGTDSLGHTIAAYVWKSSLDGTISTSPSFATTALSVGTHTISLKVQCSAGTWSPEATTTVTVAAPPDVTTATITAVSPNPAMQGASVSFSGSGTDSRGHTITAYQWRSSIDGVLSTSASFAATALSVGTHTIYFKVQCASGTWSPEVSTTLVVNPLPPDVTTATITAATTGAVTSGTSVSFSGTGTDSRGHAITAYQWRSSLDGVLSSAASFSTTALSVGTHTIFFKVCCSAGVWSPEKQVTLVVTPAPVIPGDTVTATIDAAGPTPVTAGASVTFTGHATDSLGHTCTAYQWKSSIDGILSTAASFSTTTLTPGTHTISFKAQCSSGTWSPEVTTTIVVNGVDSVTAAIDLSGPSPTTVGLPLSFVGHATDSLGHTITAYQWTSSIDGVLSSAKSFSTSALSVGTHTITFKAKCASGVWSPETQVTVVVKPLVVGLQATVLALTGPNTCAYGHGALAVELKTAAGLWVPGQTLALQSSTDGLVWSPLANVTSAVGSVGVPLSMTRATRYRLIFTGDSQYAPSVSGELLITPAASVGTPSAPKAVRKNHTFTVTGSLGPAHPIGSRCVKVYLYRFEKGSWHAKSSLWATATTSGYKASVKLTQTGKWRMRVYHAADADNGATWSGYRNVTIR